MSGQNDGSRGTDTQLNFGSVLKLMPTGFADGTDVVETKTELRIAVSLLA